jgi:hypothetical protein
MFGGSKCCVGELTNDEELAAGLNAKGTVGHEGAQRSIDECRRRLRSKLRRQLDKDVQVWKRANVAVNASLAHKAKADTRVNHNIHVRDSGQYGFRRENQWNCL